MGRLKGKVAIVTGSASGIGRESAIRMAAEGAMVVGGDLNEGGGQETVAMCREKGGDASFLQTDVTNESQILGLVEHAAERFGGIDILFNNAGATGAIGPIEGTPVEDWDRTQNILLRSAFLGIKHVVPYMKKRGSGSIISTSSIAGLAGFQGLHAYCSAKAGLINLTRSAAIELGSHRIRVNCICAGEILTPMRSGDRSAEEAEQELAKRQPVRRAGRTSDIAGAVVYLASDEAEWVTGVALPVDGGATAGIWTFDVGADPRRNRPTGFLGPSFQRRQAADSAKIDSKI
jgi:NAD(P)-dependent dehydrogenase (short-subunit alcohol dehydrogenase family)